ncbi:MAG: hypothetical protein EOO50_01885 [Flavobacterium sp.]|uniref:hypothetical protein n=1 Tax=Flavobacterium sp. TaxID=239 RepID=UPI0011FA0505|nr:hypothetical protein [Flavobacterium sp.]RZJ68192.1 MAG: hypothetical protein EOO50_01885 [Flavobacterium sp.]
MKTVSLLLMALAAFSCGSDDKETTAFQGRLLKHVTVDANYDDLDEQLDFTYDSRNRIDKIVLAGNVDDTFTYSYNNRDQVTAISKLNGDDLTFEYDNDGRLSKYTEGNLDHEVTYNAATASYEILGNQFVLKENGDILSESGKVYGYDTFNSHALKGPLRDVAGNSYQLTTYIAYYDGIIIMAKDAFNGRNLPGNPNDATNFSFTNSYDYEDYRVGSQYSTYGVNYVYSYEYFDNQ